ncbi:MAG: DUF1559 domain-containing protein [Pirellulales bacterium]|nr:DUF1559 domain-containing protein [Pirellulales bacterium]
MMLHALRARRGHSLIEMLVVLVIVAALIAITVPAVQRSRENGRQAQCIHNQGQLIDAIHMYTAKEAGGRFPGFRYQDPTDANAPVIGWAAQLFSYLGRNDLDPTQATYLEVLVCPSDQGPTNQPRLNYVANGGQADTDSPADGVFFDHAKPADERVYITKDDFGDGLSNTILLAENLDATLWTDTDKASQCILWPLSAGNQVNEGTGARPSSHHPGGFVAGFADGSVRFMNEEEINGDANVGTINSRYVALLTPGGKDSNSSGGGTGEYEGNDGDGENYPLPECEEGGLIAEYRHASRLQPGDDIRVEGFQGEPDIVRVDYDLELPFGNSAGTTIWDSPSGLPYPFPDKRSSTPLPSGYPECAFTAIFRGYIKAEYSEDYTLHVRHDDDTWIDIDGVERFYRYCCGWADSAPFAMTAGEWVPIEIRFDNDRWQHDYLQIEWSSASQARGPITRLNLRCPDSL